MKPMIRSEYLRFLQTLTDEMVSDDVRKIANLVLQHIDDLTPLSTAHGQRIRRMVELAQSNWGTINTIIQPIQDQAIEQGTAVTQLKSMTVGPFRGFARQETFDLISRLVLIYGTNGSGKSSFCEALEYGLLGNVTEADINRFRHPNDYLINAHTNTFLPPEIIGKDDQGNDIQIDPDEAQFRFCFVEKNRIDSFSRIAAQTPSRQSELISTLFGLDSFSEFVRNFTNEIDDRYIDRVGVKSQELNRKRQSLVGFTQQLASLPETFEELDREEQALALEYREDVTFAAMTLELNGTEETPPGRIHNLEIELQQQIATKSNLTNVALQALKQSISTNLTEFATKQQELSTVSQQVSFKQLYEAVIQVQPSSPEYCPACKTPLVHVSMNPYEHASRELQTLQHLAILQQTVEQLKHEVELLMAELSQIVTTCCSRYSNNVLSDYQLAAHSQATTDWWISLHQPLQDNYTPWQHLEAQVRELEEGDRAVEQATQQRSAKQTELQRLRSFADKITVLQTRRKTAVETQTKAEQVIATFDTENAPLITEVAAEVAVVTRNQTIASAYAVFVDKLNTYKNALPAQLVANMGETVVTLYNAFNRNDSINEQLSSIRLPLTQNQRLEISFQSEPATFFDALHVLSEGHIRCIGLAILMAKNLNENCPILIFDDPVNAIDDDHRESIRRTLFEDGHFNNKQIILTCHGEEFFKDIQNLLSVAQASQLKAFTFLPKLDEQHIRVDLNPAPRNYIISARAHLENGEIRDALGKSRRALESITKDKLWKYAARYGDGNLSIKLRSANAPIELRNLTEQLKSKVSKTDFGDQNKRNVLAPIEILLGINGESREWRYLNKGTHEEVNRAEFDRYTTNQIVTCLEQLDQALTS